MRTDDLDYQLPEDLIATRPAQRRDEARLLVVRRDNPADIQHRAVRDLPEFVRAEDAVTVNDSLVLRARLRARRADTKGKVEGLYLNAETSAPNLWRVLLKSNGKLRPDQRLELLPPRAEPSAEPNAEPAATLTLIKKHDAGEWTARLEDNRDTHDVLAALGAVPLPPYILQARRNRHETIDPRDDASRYQTVYANPDRPGSVAAPTAGLHLTPELLQSLRDKDASVNPVTLHVGAGTFKPIDAETLDQHPMHSERISVPVQTLRAIEHARAKGARSLVVGTTSARALESVPAGHTTDYTAHTDILIAPGYTWKRTDALLTNFHLPRSTLLAMVAALFPKGLDDLLPIYNEAINQRYRFYSFGDAMLII